MAEGGSKVESAPNIKVGDVLPSEVYITDLQSGESISLSRICLLDDSKNTLFVFLRNLI